MTAIVIPGLSPSVYEAGLACAVQRLEAQGPVKGRSLNRLQARARLMVGAALISVWPESRRRRGLVGLVAQQVDIDPQRLASSSLRDSRITTFDLLAVVEAMRGAGLDSSTLGTTEAPKPLPPLGALAERVEAMRAAAQRRPYRPVLEPDPVRMPDVRYGVHTSKPLDLGCADEDLVRACLAQGGFQRAVLIKPGVTVWADHADMPWRFRPEAGGQ
ncbi:hypothetical protein [uncultured Brevundimonas sp.]|uniref:hypothetical protein n=1 Tax=uncultured Brevundimonas sp. TaxID=213418 RepID=UPI00262FD6AD|nr:hypothetical protein [uncultured Brevundimonas sp.]